MGIGSPLRPRRCAQRLKSYKIACLSYLSGCKDTHSTSGPGGTAGGDTGAGHQKARSGHLCSGHDCKELERRRRVRGCFEVNQDCLEKV